MAYGFLEDPIIAGVASFWMTIWSSGTGLEKRGYGDCFSDGFVFTEGLLLNGLP